MMLVLALSYTSNDDFDDRFLEADRDDLRIFLSRLLLFRPFDIERERSLDRRLSEDRCLSLDRFLSLDRSLDRSLERGLSSIRWYSFPRAAEEEDLLRVREPDRERDARFLELDLSVRDVTFDAPDETFFLRFLPPRHWNTAMARKIEITAATSFISIEMPFELPAWTEEEDDEELEDPELL